MACGCPLLPQGIAALFLRPFLRPGATAGLALMICLDGFGMCHGSAQRGNGRISASHTQQTYRRRTGQDRGAWQHCTQSCLCQRASIDGRTMLQSLSEACGEVIQPWAWWRGCVHRHCFASVVFLVCILVWRAVGRPFARWVQVHNQARHVFAPRGCWFSCGVVVTTSLVPPSWLTSICRAVPAIPCWRERKREER